MTGRPVLQTQSEKRLWKSINGGGTLDGLVKKKEGRQGVIDGISAHEGTLHPAILVSAMDVLDAEGAADAEALRIIASKARPMDCTPSVRASRILLSRGEVAAATEILSFSSRSQEVFNRSMTEADIRNASGDRQGAFAAAVRALESDPSRPEPYVLLAQLDPNGEWPQRRNVQQVFDGEQPDNPPGEGRIQELYRIYYEWFRGKRELASEMLAGSAHYRNGDRDFLLASARMSVDERDWHSAKMMYSRLLPDAPPYLLREMAEACMSAGDHRRALELLSRCDQTSPRTMRDTILARHMTGDEAETMVAVRAYLDSEWAGADEYLDTVRMLIGFGMDDEAGSILSAYTDSCGRDTESLILRSVLAERSGDLMSALALASEASIRGKDSAKAKARVARVHLAMGDQVRAEKECAGLLAGGQDDPEALHIMMEIQARKGDNVSVISTCRKILDQDPGDVGTLIELARAQALTGDVASASESAHRAVRADGSHGTYIRALSALLSAGPNPDASYLCREAETRFPGDPAVRRIRGNMEFANGDYLRASATFASAASEAPGDPVLWYSKGMSDEARGDLESAEDAYDRALAIDPDEPEYWISKAAVREARGDDVGALKALRRASELDRKRTYPLVRMAMINERRGMLWEAAHILGIATRMDPSNERIRDEYSRMRSAAESSCDTTPVQCPVPEPDDEAPFDELFHVPGPEEVEPEAVPAVVVEEPVPEPEPEPEPPEAAEQAPEPVQEDAPEPIPEIPEEPAEPAEPVPDRSGELDALYSMAFSLREAGDLRGAIRTVDRGLAIDPGYVDLLKLKAEMCLDAGDPSAAAKLSSAALESEPDDADLHTILGRAMSAQGDLRGAIAQLDTAVSLGADDADVHAARGEVLERMGVMDRASECYSAAVSRDPSRLDLAEKLARMMYARKEAIAADGMLNRILRRDPGRMSAILLKAEIAHARKDDKALMAAYGYFVKVPNPGPENTVRMARLLEETGHTAEAKELVVGRPQRDVADNSVKRYAEKALRRAFAMKVSPTDPDLIGALGLDPKTAAEVTAYLREQPNYGPINTSSETFARMESRSRDAVMKLQWTDLEHEPRLPLERVFVQCGCGDADEAKEIVAYVMRAMISEPGRTDDPEVARIAMGMPKGISVYEIMRSCDAGVYRAKEIQAQII